MPKLIQTVARPFKPVLEALIQVQCRLAIKVAQVSHKALFKVQWGLGEPEHFDHSIDLYYQWPVKRSSFWVERGVFGALALKGGDVLELACGDGFNARNFYSLRSRKVIACDFDPAAIRTAKQKNSAPNVEFIMSDIRTAMPQGKFDNVVWDAAIEHFTPEEIHQIMSSIKERLTDGGILSGHTIVEREDGVKSLHQHEYEFKSKEDLKRFLTPYFKNVTVFETLHPERHNLYFWASDRIVPFQDGWKHLTVQQAETQFAS